MFLYGLGDAFQAKATGLLYFELFTQSTLLDFISCKMLALLTTLPIHYINRTIRNANTRQ